MTMVNTVGVKYPRARILPQRCLSWSFGPAMPEPEPLPAEQNPCSFLNPALNTADSNHFNPIPDCSFTWIQRPSEKAGQC